MRWSCLRIALAGSALMLTAAPSWAEDARVEVLQRQLAERDKVMLELLRRVETLEKQIGVPRAVRDSAEASKSVAVNKTASAPGSVIVTERMAERALERSLSREGALLLPTGVLEVEPSLTFTRQEDATSRFVTSGGLIVAGHLSVRSKRSEATAMTDRDPRAISRNASLSQKENISIGEK